MKRRTKIIGVTAGIAAVIGCVAFGVYSRLIPKEDVRAANEFHIVILDSEEYFYSDSGIENGIKMALQKISETSDIKVTYELVDDEGSYVNGIAKAKALAEDDSVDAVISFQNFESIGSEVKFFENAGKPFIVTMGCYDNVAEEGYEYFITDFLSAQTIGARIGQYIQEVGLKKIALCHSDTVFEKYEIKGIQSVINRVPECRVYTSQVGPYNNEEISSLLVRCDTLEIDGIVVNFYNQTDSAWLLSQLKKADKDIVLLGDYALDSSDILEEYGKDLEGVIIVPVYPYEQSERFNAFIREYEELSGETFTTAAVQYYDLFCMLADAASENRGSSKLSFMKWLKSEEGYDGIAGKLMFDENGCLKTKNCPVFVCKNGEFVISGSLVDEVE